MRFAISVKRTEKLLQAPTGEERRGTKILPMGKIFHEVMRVPALTNVFTHEILLLSWHILYPPHTNLEQAQHRVSAWQKQRYHTGATIDWRFTTADARIKLKHLYPSVT